MKAFLLCLIGTYVVHAQTHSFTVTAHYPADTLPGPLFVRGNACGLNWDQGVQMTPISHTDWAVTLTCGTAETIMDMKALIGDETWMRGGNQRVDVTVGKGVDMYPWFFKVEGTYRTFDKIHSP
jgi:hypothetical protein